MADTRELLEKELGSVYSLERELNGGGMSRVFLAEERRLGRKVVLKVLAPEHAEGVSAERFLREIQMALPRVERYLADALSRLEVGRT
jgi:serine/threonine protein kinase